MDTVLLFTPSPEANCEGTHTVILAITKAIKVSEHILGSSLLSPVFEVNGCSHEHIKKSSKCSFGNLTKNFISVSAF